jgi:hypothetical protein
LFEVVAKGCLAILLGLILTKTDLIGITIDKASANGFCTTRFLLGFLPLDTIFDRILRGLGVNPPSGDSPGCSNRDFLMAHCTSPNLFGKLFPEWQTAPEGEYALIQSLASYQLDDLPAASCGANGAISASFAPS